MAAPKFKGFQPHEYASYLVNLGTVASDRQILFKWDGTHWVPKGKEKDEHSVAYHWLVGRRPDLASAENAKKAFQAALLYASPMPELTERVIIPTLNGYVHLEGTDLVLRAADQNLGLTHCLNCAYDASGPAPERFMAFLDQVLPDPKVRARVQEYIGYTLLADARYQRAQIWLGDGANGKGVLANIVQALHGRTAAVKLDNLGGFNLSGLVGASLVYVDEVPRTPIDEQCLKSMIAGETILMDRKYFQPISARVLGKWLVLGNHLPVIKDHSSGFWRRWDIVSFGVTIPEKERDAMLAQTIIKSELAGVLNWALEGLVRLQVRGAFDPVKPAAMEAALHDAKASTNSVIAWVDDCAIALATNVDTPKDDVFSHYRHWCGRNALREVSSVQFWKRLHEQFKDLAERRVRVDDTQRRLCNVSLAATVPVRETAPFHRVAMMGKGRMSLVS